MEREEKLNKSGLKTIKFTIKIYDIPFKDLELPDYKLVNVAKEISTKAYAPYSNYHVGAALQTNEGKIYTGFNIENVAYLVFGHAEVNALYNAMNNGVDPKKISKLAIYCKNGGLPCLYCRQILLEHLNKDTEIFGCGENGRVLKTTLEDLCIMPFKSFTK